MSTSLFMLTASFVSPDDTETPHDVLAAAEMNGVHEVYPETLPNGQGGDHGPAWIEPQAAGVLTKAALAIMLDALEVGLEGAYDDAAKPGAETRRQDADAVAAWVQVVRANVDLSE